MMQKREVWMPTEVATMQGEIRIRSQWLYKQLFMKMQVPNMQIYNNHIQNNEHATTEGTAIQTKKLMRSK